MDIDPDFDRPLERRNTNSFKWDANERLFGRRDLLPFWVADMDFGTPQPVLDAIRKRCAHPVLGYEIRSDEYFDAIRDWMRIRHGWEVPCDWLMFCPPSTILGIHGMIEALVAPDGSIAIPTPSYGPLLNLIAGTGRRILRSPLREDGEGRFHLDVAHLESVLRTDTRVVLMASPNNPVGRVFRSDELAALAELAERRDLIVISDEVHLDLVLPGHAHIPFGSIGGERSITVVSPNKTFNTAGIPQATLIVPDPEIRERFRRFLDVTQLNHDSTFGSIAMIAGYRHCAPWLDRVIDYIADNHRLVGEFLATEVPGVRRVVAEGTYLAWLDFRATAIGQDEIMRRLVEIGGVGLYSGLEFGEEGRGFFRMNVACPRQTLRSGLDGIRRAMTA